ncbi:MAG: methyl-accepting chemotaxis protein [Myxococcales bacterium]|nr:methyl-accepting chemotaxis protein [Myxococcales bacterium]
MTRVSPLGEATASSDHQEFVRETIAGTLAAVRDDLTRIGGIVSDATGKMASSFSGLRQQAESQAEVLNALAGKLGTGGNGGGAAYSSFVGATRNLLEGFVGQTEEVCSETGAMADRMDAVAADMARIAGLLRKIERIDSQTNFVALNATIAAGRAGDAGKPFAVVAQEIKSLSRESSAFSEQIHGAVQSSKRRVAQAKETADSMVSRNKNVESEYRVRVDRMLEELGEVNSMVSQTLGAVSAITDEVREQTALAIRSLQFDDIVSQVVQHGLNQIGHLERLTELLTDSVRGSGGGEPGDGAAFARELQELAQASRACWATSVGQQDLEVGEIELF